MIAGRPSAVAGILMNRLGRSTIHHSVRASAMVLAVSRASRGSTSRDTRPSTPSLASYTGRSTSQPHRMSYVVISRDASSVLTPLMARSASCWS